MRYSFGVMALLVSGLINAQPFDWKPPYMDMSTVGGQLEKEFSQLLRDCKIAIPLRKTTIGNWSGESQKDPLSSIPLGLQRDALPLDLKILTPQPDSVGRLFLYLYKESDTRGSFRLDPQRLLPGSYLQNAAEMLVQGGVETIYTQTCSSVIGAAANASTNWSIPIASASAALASDYGNDKKTVFALVRGDLRSPLASLLALPNPYQKLYGSLLFWIWYGNNPAEANGSYFYLTDLNAVSLFDTYSEKGKLDGSISLKASVSFPVVGADSHIKLQSSTASSLEIKRSATYLPSPLSGATWGRFKEAPTISSIVNLAANASAQVETPSHIIAADVEHTHTQYLAGIPKELCVAALWETDYLSANSIGVLTVKGANSTLDTNFVPTLPGCTFEMSFLPHTALAGSQTPINVTLRYRLKLKSSINSISLLIPAGQVDLSTASLLTLRRQSTSGRWRAERKAVDGSNTAFDHDLIWEIKYLVLEDPNDLIRKTDPDATAIKLQCPANLNPSVTPSARYDPQTKLVTVEIRTNVYSVEGRDMDPAAASLRCTIGGTLDFTMAKPGNGGRIRVIQKPVGDGIILFYPDKLLAAR